MRSLSRFNVMGRFYDPREGYVTITTPTNFMIYDYDSWPSQETMIVTGKNSTSARLTAISNTQCRIDADLDGDGNFDNWTSGDIYWKSL